jgi:hypothetical protein
MTDAADRALALAKQTPQRVMRELYTQYVAYSRLFANKIPDYVAADDDVAVESDTIGNSLSHICTAIDNGSASAVAPLVTEPEPPTEASLSEVDISADSIMLASSNPVCADWTSLGTRFSDETASWRAIDPNVPAVNWTPEQQAINKAVQSVMEENASEMERLARRSGNAPVEDIAILAAQYRRGYASAITNYLPADNLLAQAASSLARTITWACKAAE